jgi:hypothetical protein
MPATLAFHRSRARVRVRVRGRVRPRGEVRYLRGDQPPTRRSATGRLQKPTSRQLRPSTFFDFDFDLARIDHHTSGSMMGKRDDEH